MTGKSKVIIVGSLAVVAALLLSACGVVQRPVVYQPTAVPGYGYGPGVPGGMMGGGHMGGGMMGRRLRTTLSCGQVRRHSRHAPQ